MSNEKKNSGFSVPTRTPPASAEEFIAGATRPTVATAVVPAPPPAATPAGKPWEQSDGPRIGKLVLRATTREAAILDWLYDNKPGVRSKHDYVLKAVQRQMQEDLAKLAGVQVDFGEGVGA